MPEPQTIETAPKDGTYILVWSKVYDGMWAVARWDEEKYARKPVPRWLSRDLAIGRRDLIDHPPTHWMPLPEAPAA